MYSSINGKQKGDCPTVGFPIFFSQDYEVAAEVDTSAAPLIPSAAPLGVMSNFSLDNQSCNELTLTLEFWSSVADCDGCTTEIPETATQEFTIPPNTSFNPPAGNWVDYSIDGGVFLQDGCVSVSGGRTLSTCCPWTGLTTTTNALVIPTI